MKTQITSEYCQLRKVIIHTPGLERERSVPWSGEHPFLHDNTNSAQELQVEHNSLKSFLISEIGAENVLTVRQLLTDIFDSADESLRQEILCDLFSLKEKERLGPYTDYLRDCGFMLDKYPAFEIATDLIEGCPRTWDVVDGKVVRPIISPKRSLMWTRDSAATTPAGIIISAMARNHRKEEPALMRIIFKYHSEFGEGTLLPDLLGTQPALDPSLAMAWDYIMEGGNLLVLSEESLAIGVGKQASEYVKRTNRHAFEVVVRQLFKNDVAHKIQRVYLVSLPDLPGFIHLDTVFNMVGPKTAIAMPYIFGFPDTFEKVFSPLIRRIREDLVEKKVDLRKLPTIEDFRNAGKVETYLRETYDKSGEIVRKNVESNFFLTQLEKDGLVDINNISWIGGNPDDHPNAVEHLRVALREQINQGGNIFTVKPFRSIAYHRNPFTLAALEAKMKTLYPESHLERMPSNELSSGGGGPHCLTMPIIRDSITKP